jgi:RimJ/RimL family protein N-acetyltransferase
VEYLEVGYHLLPEHQGKGLATEAAAACRDFARERGIERLVAIIVPDNHPSQRVALRIGLTLDRLSVTSKGDPIRVYAADL